MQSRSNYVHKDLKSLEEILKIIQGNKQRFQSIEGIKLPTSGLQ